MAKKPKTKKAKKKTLQQQVGDRVKALRLESKMTQEELATRMGSDQATISGWEAGRHWVKPKALERLAVVFDVKVTTLLVGREQ